MRSAEAILMKLYNTETREKEEVVSLDGKTLRLYTCGPTVYNFAHIGNFRTYLFEDLLKRALQFFGFSVIHVKIFRRFYCAFYRGFF
jgi:cysteinyl-tRNA synthetase